MRNRYPGVCYRCGKRVEKNDGHIECSRLGTRVQHATCCIAAKLEKERIAAEREKHNNVRPDLS